MSPETNQQDRKPKSPPAWLAGRFIHAVIGLILVAGLVLAVALYQGLSRSQETFIREFFTRRMETYATELQKGINTHLELLDAVGNLFFVSEIVTREDFRLFCKSALSRHPEILALEWIPRVSHEQRETFESQAEADGLAGFKFTDRSVQGKMVAAPQRDEYFPVYYVEPLAGNQAAAGFDLGSNPTRLAALEKARDTGAMTATARITLVPKTAGQYGYLIFRPVYSRGAPLENVADRRRALLGFGLVVFRIEAMVEALLGRHSPAGLDLYLIDDDAPEAERLLHFHASRTRTEPVEDPKAMEKSPVALEQRVRLQVADRTWTLIARPAPAFLARIPRWKAPAMAGAAFALACLMASFLHVLSRAATRFSNLADQREQDLFKLEITQQELGESEERYRTVVEDMPVLICRFLPGGKIEFVNQAYCVYFSKKPEELVGSNFQSLIPENERETVMANISALTPESSTFISENRLITADGKIRWQSWMNRALFDAQGTVIAYQTIGEDITARKQAEDALQQYTEELESVNESLENSRKAAMNLMQDSEMQRKRTEQALAQLERSEAREKRHAWLARGLQQVGAELAVCRSVAEVQRFAAQAPTRFLDMRMSWLCVAETDGTVRPVAFSNPEIAEIARDLDCAQKVLASSKAIIVPDTLNDPPFGASCTQWAKRHGFACCATYPIFADEHCVAALTFRDVQPGEKCTIVQARSLLEIFCRQVGDMWQRCLYEERLKTATLAAEAANQTKSDFLASMSHELRTPMNAIIGFSEVLAEKSFGELNEKQARYVNNILSSGRHLLELINDILDLSKVEAGKMELELSMVDIEKMLADSLIMIKEKAHNQGIQMNVDIPQALSGFTMEADERKLKQVMFNLLSNAVKFTPKGGDITICARFLSLVNGHWQDQDGKMTSFPMESTQKPMTPGEFIEISVIDTGIGIAPEDQERIFEEFEQIDSTFARQFAGTGLGLGLTRKLLELHGGTIRVQSEGEHKGSTFTFWLPVKIKEAAGKTMRASAEAVVETENGEKLPALVVEDDPQAAELLCGVLAKAGFSATVVPDGEKALEVLKNRKPCVILLDILLPKMSGWQVLDAVKGNPETRDIPLIVVSITEDRKLGFTRGVLEWFVKPVDQDVLIDALEKARTVGGLPCRIVLLIDDDANLVELTADALRKEGYTVSTALGGREGLDKALEKMPDLIVLDMMMPDMTGFEVIEALQKKDETRDIPILVFTAKDLSSKEQEFLHRSATTVMKKTDGEEELLKMIGRIVQDSKEE